MTKPVPIRRRVRPSEEGYVLVAVMFMLAILIISLAIAEPIVKKDLQRDREIETMHRGKQYARAIKLYYKKFGAYPPSVDALLKTNEIRFLRKKYIDPTTGKDEWKPIRFGQNKAPTAMGFFGQPIGGSTVAGTGPSGGNGLTGSSTGGGSSLFGASGGSSLLGAAGSGASPTAPPASGSTDSSGLGSTDSTGGSAAGPGTGLSGQTFGGGGIIGFSPTSPKQSILVYKKKNHYNEWEFVYDPLAEQMMQGGNTGTIGQPAASMSGSSPIGSSGISNNPGFGPTTGGSNPGGIAPAPQPQQ